MDVRAELLIQFDHPVPGLVSFWLYHSLLYILCDTMAIEPWLLCAPIIELMIGLFRF